MVGAGRLGKTPAARTAISPNRLAHETAVNGACGLPTCGQDRREMNYFYRASVFPACPAPT
ncbi:MAG: hypothetical protein KC419_06080 [Anaerolineales bacterium]|nr:hypothetical protein [Anaerolineales bacterium]